MLYRFAFFSAFFLVFSPVFAETLSDEEASFSEETSVFLSIDEEVESASLFNDTSLGEDQTEESLEESTETLEEDTSSEEEEGVVQASATTSTEEPVEVDIPQPIKPDPLAFLQGFQGNFDTDLFTGSASYAFPIALPPGRGKATPALWLRYSSSSLNANSLVGYGWSLPTNAIFRNTSHGVNTLYDRNDFAADIFGNYAKLIVTDVSEEQYAPETEGSFFVYDYDSQSDSWEVTDTTGTKYFFGTSETSKQIDPDNSSHVYKWLLDTVEDTNGNTITLTYFHDNGQVYPDTIRYSGNGADLGLYEIRFYREARSVSSVSYETGFRVETQYHISSVELLSSDTGSFTSFRTYEFSYEETGTVFDLLESITVSGDSETMPPVVFDYVDHTESLPAGVSIQKLYLLKKITQPSGGTVELLYQPSTAYRTPEQTLANNKLPFNVFTLFQMVLTDPVSGRSSTTNYKYEGGHYFFDPQDAFAREYAGFHIVTLTDSLGNVTKEYFHQSEFSLDNEDSASQGEFEDHISKKGHTYRTEHYDDSGNLFLLTIRKWNTLQLADADTENDRFFPFLERETSVTYDGFSSGRTTASTFSYDQYGNITESIGYGEVNLSNAAGDFTDTGNDTLTTTTEYAYNTTDHILSLPKRMQTQDQNSTIIAEQKISYDALPFGSAPVQGNVTKTERLASPGEYVTTTASYNSVGLPVSITNARNFTTTIAYDQYDLFPETVTNPKNHVITSTYSYLFGTPEEITDPNGNQTHYVYDGLGRLVETQVTNPNAPSELIPTAAFSYDLSSSPVSTTQTLFAENTDLNGNPIEVTGKTYFDGFGRVLQTRTEAEDTNVLVTQREYDERGNVAKEFLPQYQTGMEYGAFASSEPHTEFTYDALNRQTSVTVPYGASDTAITTTTYDRWNTTVTDANGTPKNFEYDSRGNLIRVTEHIDSTPYDTVYTYNAHNNLIRITDSQGNIKDFTYDLLGRKLTENDFHTPSDASYSSWSSEYDENGNLIQLSDSKNQVTDFTYDELDRLLTEQESGSSDHILYTYDTATNGMGRLATITSPTLTKSYEYDSLGNIIQETKTIDSTNYVTQTEYDLLGNPKQILYPDSNATTVMYQLNNAGQIEVVSTNTEGSIVTNIDYSPTGTPTRIEYANGVITTQTYDINQLYRLTAKQTTKDTSNLQNLAYTFDKNGNITNITDTSNTDTAKIANYTYDDLDRLTSATITNTANTQDYTRTFAYDSLGNITNKSDVGNYIYSQNNFANPHAVTQAGTQTFIYDNNGNLQTDGTWTHSWDYKDRLTSSSSSETTIRYEYDEAKTRVKKTNETTGKITTYINDFLDIEDGEEKLFFYSGDLKLATLETENTPIGITTCTIPQTGDWIITQNCTIGTFETAPENITITAGTLLTITNTGTLEIDLNTNSLTIEESGGILIKTGGNLTQTGKLIPPQNEEESEKKLIYHHTDHLSGASVDTNENGEILQLTDYYPYGDERIEDTLTDFHNDYTYTGKERDEDTKLLYYEARYYNSHIGRFISIDPWSGDITDPQSLNKYAYVRNNPLKYVDPDGKTYLEDFFIPWLVRNQPEVVTRMKNDYYSMQQAVREVGKAAYESSPYIAGGLTLISTENPSLALFAFETTDLAKESLDLAFSVDKHVEDYDAGDISYKEAESRVFKDVGIFSLNFVKVPGKLVPKGYETAADYVTAILTESIQVYLDDNYQGEYVDTESSIDENAHNHDEDKQGGHDMDDDDNENDRE